MAGDFSVQLAACDRQVKMTVTEPARRNRDSHGKLSGSTSTVTLLHARSSSNSFKPSACGLTDLDKSAKGYVSAAPDVEGTGAVRCIPNSSRKNTKPLNVLTNTVLNNKSNISVVKSSFEVEPIVETTHTETVIWNDLSTSTTRVDWSSKRPAMRTNGNEYLQNDVADILRERNSWTRRRRSTIHGGGYLLLICMTSVFFVLVTQVYSKDNEVVWEGIPEIVIGGGIRPSDDRDRLAHDPRNEVSVR